MKLTTEGTIELDGGRVVLPWYLEGADWREDDLSTHCLLYTSPSPRDS